MTAEGTASGLSSRALILLVLLFLAVKLPFLICSPYTFDEEEIKPGAIGHILLTDRRLPLSEYVLGGYEGGALVVGIASIPFQMLFGPTLLAFKLLAVCVSLGILVVGSLLVSRIAGAAAGLLAALLVIFSPPYLTQFQFILWGNYMETTLLTLVSFLLFHRMVFRGRTGWWNGLILGLLCGLGGFIHYGFAVTICALLVLWYLVDHRFLVRPIFWAFAAGVAAGFSPWLGYNLSHGFAGMGRVADGVAPMPLAARAEAFLASAKDLVRVDYAMAWHFRDVGPLSGRTLGYAYYLLLAVGVLASLVWLRKPIARATRATLPFSRFDLPREPRTAGLLFPVYIAGYLAVFCGTGYGLLRATWGNMDPETHAHIFVTLYPLLFFAALGIGAQAKRPALAVALGAPLLLLGAAGSMTLLEPSCRGRELLAQRYDAYLDAVYSEIGALHGARGDDWRWIPPRLEGQSLVSFYYGLGSGLGAARQDDPTPAIAACDGLAEPAHRAVCLFGVGAGVFSRYDVDPAARDAALARVPADARPWLVGGAADILLVEGFEDHPLIDEARRIFLAEGFGEGLPDPIVQYFRSRLSALRGLSVKR